MTITNFDKFGCVFVKNFIESQTITLVSNYLENKIKRGEWVENRSGTSSSNKDNTTQYAYYADPLIEELLKAAKEKVEEVSEKELLPTYSYARIYQSGEQLKPHVDRPACEVSVTVNVATKGEFSPIYIQYGNNEVCKFVLEPGDAVVYKGCEAVHWRKPLVEDQLNVQFMLHYVDKNGPYAEHVKDKRPSYGMSEFTRR